MALGFSHFILIEPLPPNRPQFLLLLSHADDRVASLANIVRKLFADEINN